MTIVPVSYWLGNMVQQSFLNQHAQRVIQNGIDLQVFMPQVDLEEIKIKYNIANKFVVLGVASIWDRRKGLDYFIQLSEKINPEFQIILVGLNRKQIKTLPQNVIGIERTENVNELAKLYSVADVFVNPTLEDTFPTTNLESLACGTPVVTFRTGGSVESVTEETGFVVEKGDLNGLVLAIDEVWKKEKKYYFEFCRKRAESLYNKNDNFQNYINLYEEILKINH